MSSFCLNTATEREVIIYQGWIFHPLWLGSLVAQMVKNLPAMQETQVQSLAQEDPLEKGMASPASILAWRIPWTEEPESYSP